MHTQQVDDIASLWGTQGIILDTGLSDEEVANIETEYHFCFPPDLRVLLMHVLPVSQGFTDWRRTHSAGLRGILAEPIEGMLDAVKTQGFWYPSWGDRPVDMVNAAALALRELVSAPCLIPVQGGVYLPDNPHEAGNPLFSVNNFDIIFAGETLYEYVMVSPLSKWPFAVTGATRYIQLWSDVASE